MQMQMEGLCCTGVEKQDLNLFRARASGWFCEQSDFQYLVNCVIRREKQAMRQVVPHHIFYNPPYLVPLFEIRLASRNALDGTACFYGTLNASSVGIDRQTSFFVVSPITEHTQFSCFAYTITKVILTFCNVSKKRVQESCSLLPGLEDRCRFIRVHSTLAFRGFVLHVF